MPSIPWFPPIDPYVLPEAPFDGLIEAYGANFTWLKSHSCACLYGGAQPGSADPRCLTCQGRGVYWDEPSSVFKAAVSFSHVSFSPDEPGGRADPKWGQLQHGEPLISIPANAGPVYLEASVYDAVVQVDSISRFQTNLEVGGVMAVPYQHGLTIAPTGAVTLYDQTTHRVTAATYAVSGAAVTLVGDYPPGTGYNVEFTAQAVYVLYRYAGGMPHVRPFGGGVVNLPRRFRFQPLDLWVRERGIGGTGPQGMGAS